MALFSGNIFSKVLQLETGLTVILPGDRLYGTSHAPCKVLWLLHGLSDNHSAWLRYTSLDRYIREHNVAVVMPECHHSLYTDEKLGLRYYTYLTDELPAMIRDMFAVSARPEDTYIAGLSMGGYGALRCTLLEPERYAGCAAFSSLTDIHAFTERRDDPVSLRISRTLFGETRCAPESSDIFALARKNAADRRTLPDIYMTCGRQDSLYPQNAEFDRLLDFLGIPHDFEDWDGTHEWGFWDLSIRKAIDRFFAEA